MTLAYASLVRDLACRNDGRRGLAVNDAQALFAAMLGGEVPPLEIGEILIALGDKGETLAETIGFMRAVDADIGRLAAPRGRSHPVVLPSYGGARQLPNLTALLALLLKRYGVPVLIHGTPAAAPGHVTTAAILWELGIEPAASLDDAQSRLDYDNIAHVPAAVLAPGLARLMDVSAPIGVRSPTQMLARLIDPFGREGYRVVGVPHPDRLARMREVLAATHADALLLCGAEGEPVADARRQPLIETFANGEMSVCADPETDTPDTPAAPPRLPAAIDAPTTGAWIARALSGEEPVPDPLVTQLGCCLEGARR